MASAAAAGGRGVGRAGVGPGQIIRTGPIRLWRDVTRPALDELSRRRAAGLSLITDVRSRWPVCGSPLIGETA